MTIAKAIYTTVDTEGLVYDLLQLGRNQYKWRGECEIGSVTFKFGRDTRVIRCAIRYQDLWLMQFSGATGFDWLRSSAVGINTPIEFYTENLAIIALSSVPFPIQLTRKG